MSDYILELEEACKTIKKYCKIQHACEGCIFHKDKGILGMMCYIQDTPEIWPVDKIFNKEDKNE